MLRNISSDC